MTQPDPGTRLADAPSRFAGLPGDIAVSFEFFPPKGDKGDEQLQRTVERLAPYEPDFVSVTYGAGGSTRAGTITALERIVGSTSVPVAGHLTCVGASKVEVNEVAERYRAMGVTHIVALRGDASPPGTPYSPHAQGYRGAAELVEALARTGHFDISVAAYPEAHPESPSVEDDIANLRRKVDAGANRALTQFFFEPETFLRFRDRAVAAGIDVPIIPGVLPITNFKQTCKFAGICGATIPDWMANAFDGLDDEPAIRNLVAATLAAEFCGKLYEEGVRDFHFYTLNRADLSYAICHLLGLREKAREPVAA
ncbi:methylenetetrahydrofolate reductase [NAD(P)H] [Aurantiacibacter spongiae]|uniref:Methylenetetrahydrofolate reductase n=1 Tax=Aurantiacibacter spongiae TaxID=2488860 RepID=A0A3N5DBW8_9SPHN|nr:methylenetetrahydrofolate reductase [NAD(P)H] [Aurantiacibacter spongiae]RPF72268.1 methylenetetrahydrofolate reductase [NAD(P)H] [Aurantiacibacter spongiae]